jgi:TonB-linked SusC/RagA family outer membrane protein
MKNKLFKLYCIILIAVFHVAMAQQTVTGSVTDEDGNLLPGATVVVKGTSSAATTDFNGNFTIEASNGDTLIISYVGFNSQELSVNGSNISAILTSSTKLDEVVVTAYGVDRAKNELTYQTERIGGESVSSNSFTSASSALAGKVAGMQINIQNNGVNPSSKIILRGFRSISGGNEALIVIDGAIASKGAFDDLNPIDIESLNVLKGATAAAIYGSNASNGAVIVTTKQGNNNSKFTIGVNSTFTTEEIAYTPEFQTEYGTGWDGHYDPIENTNWGPRFDGVLRRVGPLFPVGTVLPEGTFQTTPDGQPYQVLPYAPVQDHIKDFFETGETFQNSVYLRGGDSTSNIYLSMGNQQTKGIILRDSYKRSTIKLNASKQIGDVKVGINSNFLMDKTSEVGNTIGDQDREFYWFVVNTPANIPLKNYKNWKTDIYASPDGYFNAFYQNPYWAIDTNRSNTKTDRANGNAYVEWEAADWIKLKGQVHYNKFSYFNKNWRAAQEYDPVTQPYHSAVSSFVSDSEAQSLTYGYDFFADIKLDLTQDFSLKALVGASSSVYKFRSSSITAVNLSIPDFYDISNGTGELQGSVDEQTKSTYGYFTDLNIGYQKMVYLNLAGRYDYTSVLPTDENGYFYPSLGLSFILADKNGNSLIPSLESSLINYAKFTVSNSTVYNDSVGIYSINERFFQSSAYPYGSVNGFYLGGVAASSDIKKEKLASTEFGLNLGLFDNRITVDASYYLTKTSDLLTYVTSSPSSGSTSLLTNVGNLDSSGLELTVNANVLNVNDFAWDLNINYTTSETTVEKLAGDTENVQISGPVYAALGEAYPQLRTVSYERDPQGRVIVDPASGNPKIGGLKNQGRALPKHVVGLTNTLTYKAFTLSTTIDYRTGHVYYSELADLMEFTGSSVEGASSNRQDFVFPNSVVETSPGVYTENTNIPITGGRMGYWQNHHNEIKENYVRDASAVKIREIAFRYDVPKKYLDEVGLSKFSFGVVGRNLITWLPEENRFSDPEFNNSTTNGVGVGGYQQSPPTRNFGFTLNIEF